MPSTNSQSNLWSLDYDSSKGIIYTAVNYDTIVLFYQINIINGESFGSKYKTSSSWTLPYDTLFNSDRVFLILRCASNQKYLIIFYPDTDRFENFYFDTGRYWYSLLKDPITQRYSTLFKI